MIQPIPKDSPTPRLCYSAPVIQLDRDGCLTNEDDNSKSKQCVDRSRIQIRHAGTEQPVEWLKIDPDTLQIQASVVPDGGLPLLVEVVFGSPGSPGGAVMKTLIESCD